MKVEFFVPGVPLPQPRPRARAMRTSRGHIAQVYDVGTTDGWKKMILVYAMQNRPDAPVLHPAAFSVRIIFHMPRPKYHLQAPGILKDGAPHKHIVKPDADNLAKCAIDALTDTGLFWHDDGAVQELYLAKQYSLHPGIHITISSP